MSELIIDKEGTKRWLLDGELHRVDGPAIEWLNGTKKWYLAGLLHRVDGPAIEWADGGEVWWLNGGLHRDDGPAIEYADGTKGWFLYGKKLTKESWFEMLPEDSKMKALFSEHFFR
jgi:hypothetical protein